MGLSMKNSVKILFPLFVFFLLVTGCSKENPVQSSSDDISGSWKLVKVSGGIAGRTTEPSPNSVEIITITNSGKFTKYLNNEVVFSSDITIQCENSIYSQEPVKFINFVSNPGYYTKLAILNVTGRELILADNYFDGYSYYYVPVSRH